MKKILSIVLAGMMVVSLAACGGSKEGSETDAAPSSESTSESDSADSGDDGQNPVMNFIGTYVMGRAALTVESGDDEDGAKVSVVWSSSASESSEWTMSGKLDADTLTMEYEDCVKKNLTFGEDGKVAEESTEYENGKGRIIFNEDGTLTWEDDEEHMADGQTFEFLSADGGDSDDGQNPVMNIIGEYSADRASATIKASGTNGADIVITWADSAFENNEWTMSGVYNEEANAIEYTDCVKTTTVYGEDGSVKSSEEAYNDGTGRIVVNDDYTLTWEDDKEDAGKDIVFSLN